MTTTDAQGNIHDRSGQFAEKINSAPATGLVEQTDGLYWVVEGDDHETVVVLATSPEEAIEQAVMSFSDQYGEDYSEDLLVVKGAFLDEDGEEFVPVSGFEDEGDARRARDNAL